MTIFLKRNTITLVFLCFFLNVYSQEFECGISKGIDVPTAYKQLQILTTVEGEYLVFATAPPRFGRANAIKDLLSNPSKGEEEAHVEMEVAFKNTKTYGFLENTKEFTRVIVEKNKKEKKVKQYFQKFDSDGKEFDIIEYSSFTYESKNDIPDVESIFSDDNELALLFDSYDINNKKVDYKAGFTVVDNNLQILHMYEYNPGISQKQCQIEFLNLQNDGSFSFLVKKYKSDKAKEVIKQGKTKIPGYDYFLSIKQSDLDLEEIKIDLDNEFVRGGVFTNNVEGDIIMFFPYNSDSKSGIAIGYYIINVDSETKEVTKVKYTFSDQELEQFGRWKKSQQLGLDDYFEISPIIAKNKNQIAFSVERLVFEPFRNLTAFKHMSSVSFIFNQEGVFQDYLHVPKNFYEYQAKSFAQPKFINEQLYLFYNDNKDNFDVDLSQYAKMKKKILQSDDNLYYAYKNKGTVKRNLISDQISGGYFNSDCLIVDGNKIIIACTDWEKGDEKLKIITLEKID